MTDSAAPRRSLQVERISEVIPPEGVPLRFTVASLGARFGAQVADILITSIVAVLFLILVATSGIASGDALFILFQILFFALRVPYYVAAELIWNGQTLGKRFLGLRVISSDGRSLTAHQVTVRNLMKEMEVFVPGLLLLGASGLSWQWRVALMVWVSILLIVPLRNRRRQRFGDLIAGTYVVEIPRPVLLPDLAQAAPPPDADFAFLPHHLDHYGRFELQTLERLLQTDRAKLDRRALKRHEETLRSVTDTIIGRIDYGQAVSTGRERAFLQAFYRTQRAYLENKKLFGDARENKFHRTDPDRDGQGRP